MPEEGIFTDYIQVVLKGLLGFAFREIGDGVVLPDKSLLIPMDVTKSLTHR